MVRVHWFTGTVTSSLQQIQQGPAILCPPHPSEGCFKLLTPRLQPTAPHAASRPSFHMLNGGISLGLTLTLLSSGSFLYPIYNPNLFIYLFNVH